MDYSTETIRTPDRFSNIASMTMTTCYIFSFFTAARGRASINMQRCYYTCLLSFVKCFRISFLGFIILYALVLFRMQTTLVKHENERTGIVPNDSKPTVFAKKKNDSSPPLRKSNPLAGKVFVKPRLPINVKSLDIWESSTVLPLWMKDYFRWHKEQSNFLRVDKNEMWKSHQYMVMNCDVQTLKCGGFADRLMSVPFMIRVAAQSQRLLYIKWGRPAEIEEFLLPPIGGMDWRVPKRLGSKLNELKARYVSTQDDLLKLAVMPGVSILNVRFQSHDHGSNYYNANRPTGTTEPSFEQVFHDCWRVLFTPTDPVASRVEKFLGDYGMIPGTYAAAHLRALYQVKERDPRLVKYLANNAVNCTSHLNPGGPIFFASDSKIAVDAALAHGENTGMLVASLTLDVQPLHLDKTVDWKKRKSSEFYDTFVDFYLLALGKCVAYSMGGYGLLASYVSYNSSCAMQHHSALGPVICEFRKPPFQNISPKQGTPIFLPAMKAW